MNLSDAIAKLREAGFEDRPQQTEMMQLVEQTLKTNGIAVIEGGTGIGKTFGYLIPALLNRPKDTHLVVATATVNLQSQLAEVDIPHLQKILGIKINAEIAKGRRRYICLNRLYHHHSGQSELALFGVDAPSAGTQATQQQVEKLISSLETHRWSGDRDDLDLAIEPPLWQQLTTDAAGCNNKRCAFFQDCPYFKARRRLSQADVIIANHDLLLSDIAMGTGSLLPKIEKTVYIIDEAHHFPQKAVQHFSTAVPLRSAQEWIDNISKGCQTIFPVLGESDVALTALLDRCHELKNQLEPLSDLVAVNFNAQQQEGVWLVADPAPFIAVMSPLAQSAKYILLRLVEVRQKLTERHDEKTLSNFDQHLNALGIHIHHSEMLYRTFELFCRAIEVDQPPIARWFSVPRDTTFKAARPHFWCHAAMISASSVLVSQFWDKVEKSVILCSATLRSLGQFEDFLVKTGLEYYPTVKTAAFASPFHYQHSELRIPLMKTVPQGTASDAHTQEVREMLPELLQAAPQGTLVLFTSQKIMEIVYAAMTDALKALILVQGDFPKPTLIKRHKQMVDQGKPSIIFGLQSFAEGVDLPGHYCSQVIITKLPFSVPSTPIERTWIKWLGGQGKNGFMHHTLPEASLRLTQYVGRLIRTQQDIGTVVILDRRMVTKFYGKQLLANLPPFRVNLA